MRYFKYYLVLSFILLFASRGYATSSDIASSNWSVGAKPSVIEMGFDKTSIARFIELLVDAYNVGKAHKRDDIIEINIKVLDDADIRNFRRELYGAGIITTRVGDFKWIDLDADGVYELLVSVDYSGRAFFNNLYIVKQRGQTYTYQWIFVENVGRFDEVIEDLEKGWRGSMTLCFRGCKMVIKDMDNDGSLELIIPIKLTEYRGARPYALWTAIYKWNGEKFQDASEQFKDFYQTVLLPKVDTRIRELEEEMRKFQSELDSLRNQLKDEPKSRRVRRVFLEELEESLSAEWIIRDKISRLLGDPLAGLEKAKKWAESPNINLRKNAIVVFEDIKDEESLSYLELLSHDPNPSVAQKAQHTLKRIKKKP
ncbi:MAG: hypothetical protein ACE5KE_13950 [Methanosarcinales archaeon]